MLKEALWAGIRSQGQHRTLLAAEEVEAYSKCAQDREYQAGTAKCSVARGESIAWLAVRRQDPVKSEAQRGWRSFVEVGEQVEEIPEGDRREQRYLLLLTAGEGALEGERTK